MDELFQLTKTRDISFQIFLSAGDVSVRISNRTNTARPFYAIGLDGALIAAQELLDGTHPLYDVYRWRQV